MTKPLFITFDGPNGVGKSTISDSICASLERAGEKVLHTREPTRSSLGELCRAGEENVIGMALACLVAADRYYHLQTEVEPALATGRHVVSDRYVESSLVLQRLDGLTVEVIWEINRHVRRPDLSIILTAPPDVLELRLAARGSKLSRFERTASRADEVAYYAAAGEFLTEKGFNVLFVDGTTDLETIQTRLSSIIRSM